MMRRTRTAGLAIGAALLLAGLASCTNAAAQQVEPTALEPEPVDRTLQLSTELTEKSNIDLGDEGLSFGDYAVSSEQIVSMRVAEDSAPDAPAAPAPSGHLLIQCTSVPGPIDPSDPALHWLCHATIAFDDGTVSVHGEVFGPGTGVDSSTIAVVGGTGQYVGVAGTLTIETPGVGTDRQLTLNLRW